MSSITLNGLKAAMNGEVSTTGFWCNDATGWNDYSATPQADPRVDQPGSFSADEAYATGVTPTFSGVYEGATGYDAAYNKAFLKSIISQGMKIPVQFDDSGFVTTRDLFVAKVSITHNRGQSGFKWAVDLWGDDPYMYGPEQVATTGLPKSGTGEIFPETYPVNFGTPTDRGQLVVNNSGFAPAFSKFEITGGFDSAGFTIVRVNTGERISLARVIPVASTVYIDPRSGRVSIDGTDNDISGFLTQYDWWETEPMTTETLQFLANGTVTGTPILTARTKPAYY